MRKIFLILFALQLVLTVAAQNPTRDKVVFTAMSEELARTGKLTMNGAPSPFYTSYHLVDMSYFSVQSVLGAIISKSDVPIMSQIGVKSKIGSYTKNSILDFSGAVTTRTATSDNDAHSLKTSYWELTDAVYKRSLQEHQAKYSALQQIQLSPEISALEDFSKLSKVESIIDGGEVNFNKEKWSNTSNELSSIFLDYPTLTNTYVTYGALNKTYYTVNSEGSKIKQPQQLLYISAYAEIQDDAGQVYRNSIVLYAKEESEFPSIEELRNRVNGLAKNVSSLYTAEVSKDYYCGPVMYVDGAATQLFTKTLISSNEGLIASKGLTKSGWIFNPIERRFGKKVIDNKFTVKNYTDLKEYNNVKLSGAYEIDADGVEPSDEMTLVENGLLKSLLGGRYTTPKLKETTGSSRYNIMSNNILKSVAPGVLHISSSENVKFASMKKKLIKMAKSEGLTHTYVVYNASVSSPVIYRIDVKTGKELLVKSVSFQNPDISMLRNIPIISKEESVNNILANGILASIISPKAIILNEVEIDESNAPKMTAPIIKNPLLRK